MTNNIIILGKPNAGKSSLFNALLGKQIAVVNDFEGLTRDLKEIELMKVIASGNNPHVVNMIGAVTRQEPMCVVTEFLEHGDLLSYLKASRKRVKNC